MTPQEKIKEVYESLGFEWKIVSKYITDFGVLVLPTPDLKYSLKGYQNLVKNPKKFVSFSKNGLSITPRELHGFYNNNGWTKINSEDDLPQDGNQYCFVPFNRFEDAFIGWIDQNFQEVFFVDPKNYCVKMHSKNYFDANLNSWLPSQITHFKAIFPKESFVY